MTADVSPTMFSPEGARPPAPARTRWWGFWLFALVSIVHVVAIIAGADALVPPTKLLLMPALVFAALWALRGAPRRAGQGWLVAAIAATWLGDGAGTFFPFAPTLPMMLLWFGVAHLAYMTLFLRCFRRPIPPWTAVYALW